MMNKLLRIAALIALTVFAFETEAKVYFIVGSHGDQFFSDPKTSYCPSGYGFSVTSCPDGQTLVTHTAVKQCRRCNGVACENGYSTISKTISDGQVLAIQTTNQSCTKVDGEPCALEYSTIAKTPADGQNLSYQENNNKCSQIEGTACESGYATSITNCSGGLILTSQNSNSSCRKCSGCSNEYVKCNYPAVGTGSSCTDGNGTKYTTCQCPSSYQICSNEYYGAGSICNDSIGTKYTSCLCNGNYRDCSSGDYGSGYCSDIYGTHFKSCNPCDSSYGFQSCSDNQSPTNYCTDNEGIKSKDCECSLDFIPCSKAGKEAGSCTDQYGTWYTYCERCPPEYSTYCPIDQAPDWSDICLDNDRGTKFNLKKCTCKPQYEVCDEAATPLGEPCLIDGPTKYHTCSCSGDYFYKEDQPCPDGGYTRLGPCKGRYRCAWHYKG